MLRSHRPKQEFTKCIRGARRRALGASPQGANCDLAPSKSRKHLKVLPIDRCCSPARSSLIMERLWSSPREAACEALESIEMETAFAVASFRAAYAERTALWSLVFSVGRFFASARVVSFRKPLPASAAPSLRRRLARAGFVHAAV